MNYLEIKNLDYTYEASGTRAIKDLSLNIPKGQIVGFIGENGSGKSTLLKCITNLLSYPKGDIYFEGNRTKNFSIAQLSTKIGLVLQESDRQIFSKTVWAEVAFGPRNIGLKGEALIQRVDRALNSVGLSEKKETYPPALSTGDRAKVVLASVLAMGCDCLVLDEPLRGQDYSGMVHIMGTLKKLQEEGRTIIIVTHDMTLVSEFIDYAFVLKRGSLIAQGSPDFLFSQKELLLDAGLALPIIVELCDQINKKSIVDTPLTSCLNCKDFLSIVEKRKFKK